MLRPFLSLLILVGVLMVGWSAASSLKQTPMCYKVLSAFDFHATTTYYGTTMYQPDNDPDAIYYVPNSQLTKYVAGIDLPDGAQITELAWPSACGKRVITATGMPFVLGQLSWCRA